jgi:hypothetical protein
MRGLLCAVEMRAVEKAVPRLQRVVSVPMAGGKERAVAFVDERPFPIADLSVAEGEPPRSPLQLERCPALVLAAESGSVAVAVEGPLELAEETVVELAAASESTDPLSPRLRGRLASGASVFDAEWMLAWAARSSGT